MKLSEILTPEVVEHRIRRTFQLRRLIKTLQKENAEILSEMRGEKDQTKENRNENIRN